MATNNQGVEQDYDFVEQPDQDYYCPVSLDILLEPHQTLCCGHHISQEAANRLTREGKPCPMCKSENLATQVDKYFKRKVKQLKVRCPHKKSGCYWVGELGDLNLHSNSCPKRPWKCEHCDFETTYEIGTNDHAPNCTKYPTPCPNHCEIGTIPHCDIEKHLLVCPLQLVECEFASAGCNVKVPRIELAKHMTENAQHHLMSTTLLNLRLTRELHQKIEEKDQQIVDLQQQVKDLNTEMITNFKQHTRDLDTKLQQKTKGLDTKLQQQSAQLIQCVSDLNKVVQYIAQGFTRHDFTLMEFKKHQARRGHGSWYSDPFYSHPGGYRFKLNIDTNGSGGGNGTHLSAYLYLLPGVHDKELKWPIKCTIELEMLNQRGDYGHHKVLGTAEYAKATSNTDGLHKTIGPTQTFFPLVELRHNIANKTEYLKNDRLHFQLHLKVEPTT